MIWQIILFRCLSFNSRSVENKVLSNNLDLLIKCLTAIECSHKYYLMAWSSVLGESLR